VKQPPYTLDQVRANLKLIAGITAMDLPHPNLHRGRMTSALMDVETALGDVQNICADILVRGIVGDVVVPAGKPRLRVVKRLSPKVTITRFGKIWRWLVSDAGGTVAVGLSRTKQHAKKEAAIECRLAGGAK